MRILESEREFFVNEEYHSDMEQDSPSDSMCNLSSLSHLLAHCKFSRANPTRLEQFILDFVVHIREIFQLPIELAWALRRCLEIQQLHLEL
jgi:hypothetical protein